MRAWPLVMLFVAAPLFAAEPLADFSIFKSFYRPEVTVRWVARVPAEQLAPYRLVATLNPADQRAIGTLQRQSVPSPLPSTGSLKFDTTRLGGERYAIDVELIGPDDRVAQHAALYFPVLNDPAVKSRLVTVRPSDNMLIVQGKPFFPIGIYESPGAERHMKRLADAGFNLCHVPGGPSPMLPKLLDAIQAHGMRVWISVSSLMDFSKDADKRRVQLSEMVRLVGNHPGLLCWESMDEPVWGKQSAEGYYDGYCFLRELDQQHLIWTNHAPRNTIAELAHFNRATDIAGCDIYPVPEGVGHSDLPDKTISVTGDETDKSFASVNHEKPVFMVLQGFGWRELSPPDPKNPPVMPTFAQSRFMVYDAIVHGANGILYWGTHYTKKPSRFWSELRSVVSELAALQHVLASEAVAKAAGAASCAACPDASVRMLHKRTGGYNYLILVNEKPEAVKVTVTAPGVKAKALRRLFEPGNYGIQRGKVSLALAAHDVAVLSDNLRFAGERKDFSAEWMNAANVPPPVLTEPGNLIANPGFEVDSTDTGMPDTWNASIALTATMSDTAHSGKKSLRLQGLGGDLGPLAVQRRVEVKANQKYRFSAWVKTEGPIEVRFYTEWVTDTFHAHCLPWTKGTGEWQKLEFTFSGVPDPKGGAYAVVQVKGEGAAHFDDLRMEAVE